MLYSVYRNGKCIRCGQHVREYLGNFEAIDSEEAKCKAIDNWMHDNFGQSGVLQENDKSEEEIFLNAEFIAKETKE